MAANFLSPETIPAAGRITYSSLLSFVHARLCDQPQTITSILRQEHTEAISCHEATREEQAVFQYVPLKTGSFRNRIVLETG